MTAAPEDIKRARDLLTFGLILLTLGTIRIMEGGIDFPRVWPLFILAAAAAR